MSAITPTLLPGATGVEAILLAAGESRRMGSPKALLAWGRQTLVAYQVGELFAAGVERVIIVVGHEPEAIVDAVASASFEASRLTVVHNPEYRAGKTTSIRAGACALSARATGALLLAVDQPRPAAIHRLLLAGAARHPDAILVPTSTGRRGHPILVPARLHRDLTHLNESARGLRALLEQHASTVVEVDVGTSVVHVDCNDPAAYAEALSAWAPT